MSIFIKITLWIRNNNTISIYVSGITISFNREEVVITYCEKLGKKSDKATLMKDCIEIKLKNMMNSKKKGFVFIVDTGKD